MAATINPCANINGSNCNANGIPTTDWPAKNPDNSDVGPYVRGLKHRVRISVNWTREEQCLLEDLLVKYASYSRLYRYAKIAIELPNKTVWDVAVRCRWMTSKGIQKQRGNEKISSRKKKNRKVKNQDQQAETSSHATNHSNDLDHTQSSPPMDIDNKLSSQAIGGVSGLLLEQNARALDQISANLSALNVDENIGLFYQTGSNILALLNKSSMYNCESNEMSEMMKPMPPLPVKLNDIDELTNCIFPQQQYT